MPHKRTAWEHRQSDHTRAFRDRIRGPVLPMQKQPMPKPSLVQRLRSLFK